MSLFSPNRAWSAPKFAPIGEQMVVQLVKTKFITTIRLRTSSGKRTSAPFWSRRVTSGILREMAPEVCAVRTQALSDNAAAVTRRHQSNRSVVTLPERRPARSVCEGMPEHCLRHPPPFTNAKGVSSPQRDRLLLPS
ncbi:MAG: hypothetical protein JWN02_537 [Acidobacteria bacterium]|jgi:hypothetical protein|nr:hypothetical protein [Acidobacteriota bacterium]